jgi:hypothetical protein
MNGGLHTGGGGGGSGYQTQTASKGGSGIIIIRYLNPSSSSSIELLRGTTTDANHDWKLGNYNGDFIIKKSVNNVETDVFGILKDQTNGRDVIVLPDGDLNVAGTIYTNANISAMGYITSDELSTRIITATGNISGNTLTSTGNNLTELLIVLIQVIG